MPVLSVSVENQQHIRAHLFFAATQANAQKKQRGIFCQRTDRQSSNKKYL